MNQKLFNLIRYTGFVFMVVCTIMFYNHLFTAARNPKFFTMIYFNMFNEAQIELLIFTIAIPFIIFTIANEYYNILKHKESKRSKVFVSPVEATVFVEHVLRHDKNIKCNECGKSLGEVYEDEKHIY